MIINDRGRQIILEFEGCRLTAYRCPAGVWTIGAGHTGDVKEGDVITKHQAEVILEHDLERFEQAVMRLAPKSSANEFSALVSLSFNIGIAALERSSLLRAHNAGCRHAASLGFSKWVRGGGKVLPGLVRRRAAEAALYLEAVN